jgi:argininosuccinate lyase
MTHLRHAQPVGLSHLLLSYLAALQRDRGRLSDALSRMDESPLGSAALVGTGLAIDRAFVAKRLGFAGPTANSIDGVTDRDFVVELLSALALTGLHLARIAEDLILFSTEAFGYLRFDEKLLTGSSMMPQKQNPDFLELIRAGCARVSGHLAAGLTLFKGLPSGYQRDLQWDKVILFEALDQAQGMVELLTDGFGGLRWNEARMRLALEDQALYATDLAEYLAMKKIPWALAHRAVGRLLAHAQERGIPVARMPLKEIRRFSPAFGPDLYRLFDPRVSVARKRSFGSTSPKEVARAIRRWRRLLTA